MASASPAAVQLSASGGALPMGVCTKHGVCAKRTPGAPAAVPAYGHEPDRLYWRGDSITQRTRDDAGHWRNQSRARAIFRL